MDPLKRKAEVLDLTAEDELASRSPKRANVERHCVIDLSPTVVDLASDAEAAAAPANPGLPHKSLPPSPQVIDSDDDAPSGPMALADGSCAALEENLSCQDHQKHVRGTAATEGCPGPETTGNKNVAHASSGLKSGVQDAGQLSARAAAVAPAVSAFFGQFAGSSNAFQAAAVLLAAAGKPPPQLLQALLNTALQPPLPAILQTAPRSAASVQPSAAAAAPLQQPLQLQPLQRAALEPAPGTGTAEQAVPSVAAGPEAAEPPQLQSVHGTAAPVASAAEGGRSEDAALPVAGQLPHLRPVKVPSRISPAQGGAPSDPALQAAAVSLSSAESSSGILLAPREASPRAHAAGMSECNALDKPQSFTLVNPPNNMGKAAPGQSAADSPDSSATESMLMGSPAEAAGAAVCSTSASRPGRAACGAALGIVCGGRPGDNSKIRPRQVARSECVVSTTDLTAAALTSGGPASADVEGPVSTPNSAPGRSPSAGVTAATAAHSTAAASAPIAAAAPGRAGTATGAHGLGNVYAPENAGITGVPGAKQDAIAARPQRVCTSSGAAVPAAAAPRASAGPDSSATVTDSDVAGPGADDSGELQSGDRSEVGVAGGSAAGAGSTSAGGLPRRIRSPPQRLEPTFHGKKHSMAALNTTWTADDAWQVSGRSRGRRGRGGSKLGGTIPCMFRSSKSGRGRPKGVPACKPILQQDAAAPSATQAEESQPSAPHCRQQSVSRFHQVSSSAGANVGAEVEAPRGLQRSAATEVPGQAAGGSTLPTVLKEESNGGRAKSLERSAAADVRKRRRRSRMILLEDSEAFAPVERSGGMQQSSGSDDIWLCSEDDNDECEELAPKEDTCCRPVATAPVARQTINGLGSKAAHAASGGKFNTGTQGRGLQQRAAAAHDRAELASPATVLIKEEPTAEACRQAAEHRGQCRVSDSVDRCCKPLRKELRRRREQAAAVEVPMQGLSSSGLSAGLVSIPATGTAPHEAAGGLSDVDLAAAAAVGALRLKQTCRPPRIRAETMDMVKENGGGCLVMEPASREAVVVEEPPPGMPNRAAAGPPDKAAPDAPEQAPSGMPNRAAAGPPDQAAAEAPEQAASGGRAAAAPLAGASGSGPKLPHRRLTARKITGGARPPAPAHRVAAPAACASPQGLDVAVVAARSDEDTDDELVHEIYSEEVHAMLQQALSDRSRKRNPKTGLELLPLSYSTIPGKVAQRKAEEAVQAYFALTAEQKRAYMRSRVEVFDFPAAFMEHPAQRYNVATMRHLDPDRQVERGLRAVQDMPAFTLMGEYCGVVKTGDAAEAASAEDPMGFGGLKNDKLKDFCHSHPERNVRPQGLWSEGMELVVDPCRAGNALRYINDYQGMPGGVTKNVATVEVFDHDKLRPHILFFTIQAVSAGQELLMDYGEQFRRFILSEGNRAKSLVAARKAAAEAQREVEAANAKTAEAMEEVLRSREVVELALQEAEDAHTAAKLARKEARRAKREKAELENLLKKHGIKPPA